MMLALAVGLPKNKTLSDCSFYLRFVSNAIKAFTESVTL